MSLPPCAPCPFCRAPASKCTVDPAGIGPGYAYEHMQVRCRNIRCMAAGPWRKNEKSAVKAWNQSVEGRTSTASGLAALYVKSLIKGKVNKPLRKIMKRNKDLLT